MATVRVWDDDWKLLATVEQGWRADEPMTVTVPADTEWIPDLLRNPRSPVHLTVDGAGQRRVGRVNALRYIPGEEGYARLDFDPEHEVIVFDHRTRSALDAMTYAGRSDSR